MFKEVENSKGIYRSLVDLDNEVFCMDFNPTDTKYPEELINYAYNREVYYLKRLSKYKWCPELLDNTDNDRKIYFKYYGNTCEEYIPDNFYNQLLEMVGDLHKEQIYKPAFYKKYFYADKSNIMHGFTWYSSSNYDEQPLSVDFFRPILNSDRLELIEKLATDCKLDVGILIEKAFNNYIEWPDNALKRIYERVYQ